MIKVFQTKFGTEGNCLEACIASLLEVDIEQIPILPKDGRWLRIINSWLVNNHNIFLLTVEITNPAYIDIAFNNSYQIAVGEGARGLRHAVIYKNGELVHDPFPEGAGIKEVLEYDLLVKCFD